MHLLGIHHIALNVRQLDQAERFYTDILGFKVLKRFSKGLRHLILEVGNSQIALFEVPDLEIQPHIDKLSETGYMHFAFQIDKEMFQLAVKKLLANNIDIGGGPVRRGDGDSVYFQDLDYNHLEIHCDDGKNS
jgi:catechol 2,3-dioxygenase-like lactoylglutathione lyase family enzyme